MSKRKKIPTTVPQPIDEREARRIQRKARALDVRKLIEKGFARKTKVVERNKTEVVTAFEAILRLLTDKANKGDKRAPRLIGLYQDYALRDSGSRSQTIISVRAPSVSHQEESE